MQELNKKDYARIKKVNQTYHHLGITWVPGIEEKLGQAYGKAFQAFVERCQNNEEWRNAYLFMQNYKDVVNFDSAMKNFSYVLQAGKSELIDVEVNGKKEVVKVNIKNKDLNGEDIEILEDMIMIAINDANKKVDSAMEEAMGAYGGALNGLF